MANNTYSKFPARRLAINAAMIGLYFAISMLAIPIGGFKLTFEHLPVILSAVLFGPIDALIVGALGELINQLLTYGITPTTLLWMAPAMFRGLSMGLCAILIPKYFGREAILSKKIPAVFIVCCVLSGLICSLINTYTLYVDSKMYGYYSYAMVFGVFWIRLGSSAVSSVLMSMISKPIVHALRKSKVF